MPSRFATPAVMLWWTMSACSTSSSAIFEPVRRLQVERDVALAALAAEERLAREPHAVAGDRLDLDDLRAEVADDHRAERAGEVLAEVDEADAFERVHQAASPLNAAISASL